MKQKRPRAAHRPITEAWKRLLVQVLEERDMTRKDLAVLVDATPAAITMLLRPGTKSTRLADLICKALDLPGPEFVDERDAELIGTMRALRDHNPDELDRVIALANKALRRPRLVR